MFGMADYDHYKEYILSTNIHWSYAAMRGRWEDVWLQQVDRLPTLQLITHLCVAGFRGVEVDRAAYADSGRAFEANLQQIVGRPMVESANRHFAFYDLTTFDRQMKSRFTAEEWSQLSQAELNTVFVRPSDGMGPVEGNAEHSWRWCDPDSTLVFYNRLSGAHTIDLEMSIYTGHTMPASLTLEYAGSKDEIQISLGGTNYRRSISVGPGRSVMHLRSNAKAFKTPGDQRTFYFRLVDLRVQQAENKAFLKDALYSDKSFSIFN